MLTEETPSKILVEASWTNSRCLIYIRTDRASRTDGACIVIIVVAFRTFSLSEVSET